MTITKKYMIPAFLLLLFLLASCGYRPSLPDFCPVPDVLTNNGWLYPQGATAYLQLLLMVSLYGCRACNLVSYNRRRH